MLPGQGAINALAKAGKISNTVQKFGHMSLLAATSYNMGSSEGYATWESARSQGFQAVMDEIEEKAIEQFNSEE
jgi:type V secretory pathway adhesin AidA